MPSSKAILHDLTRFCLRSDKAYTQHDLKNLCKPIIDIEPTKTIKLNFDDNIVVNKVEESVQEEVSHVNVEEEINVVVENETTVEVESQSKILEEEKNHEVENKNQPHKRGRKGQKEIK